MIIVVSDIHLGYNKSNSKDFFIFLEKCYTANIDHLILLGDIVDFWRRDRAEAVIENARILDKIAKLNIKKINYVVGNHDYYLLELNERYSGNFPFIISKYLRLEDGGKKFYLMHGYDLEVANLEPLSIDTYEELSEGMCFADNFMGGLLSDIWALLNKNSVYNRIKKIKRYNIKYRNNKINRLALSEGKYLLLGMRPDEILVFGHTHKPFINEKARVINTGCWVNENDPSIQNTYLKISNGFMELKTFDENNFP
jgi:UDP-2,3-diacylglucosamine pyrophosphatase LpxH